MSNDEEFIIKTLKDSLNTYIEGTKVTKILLTTEQGKILLNLIEKQQKEIEEEKEKNKFINEVKAIGTDDVVNVVLTKSQYEYLLERATNGFNKEKEKNKEYENKIKAVLELIDTRPYTAYTLYGDILYDDENIREILEERN